MKKVAVVVVAILFIAIFSAYFYFSGKEYIFSFSEEQLHDKLATKLPLNKRYFLIFEVTLDNPRVNLTNGSDRVSAGLDIILNIWINNSPKPFGGSLDANGGIRYDKTSGQFFLTDPRIENLSMQGIPEKYIRKANEAATKALRVYYENHPIYTLKPTDIKHAVARLALKDVRIDKQLLIITLGI